jgi:ubiquitin carboxyl-terminal hydrolase 7
VGEFNCLLSEALEKESTEVAKVYNDLFVGESQSVIRCINADFESARTEKFAMISLNVKGNATIEQSFQEYVAAERMTGEN